MKLLVNDKPSAAAPVTIVVAPLHEIPNLPPGYYEVSRWTDGTGTTTIRCWPHDRSRSAATNDEQRGREQQELLDHVGEMVGYWAGQRNSNVPESMSTAERLDGLAFSIFVALDGGAAVGPYELRAMHEDGTVGEDIAGELHERMRRSQ